MNPRNVYDRTHHSRIHTVDFWKGLTIISVLNIHACFWSGRHYLPEWTREISLLLDVPVFFFIAGYLMADRRTERILRGGVRQVLRILTDYAVVGLTVMLLTVALRIIGGQQSFPNSDTTIASFLLLYPSGPFWDQWRVFGGSMWFLHVYLPILPFGLLILALFPWQVQMASIPFALICHLFLSAHYIPPSPSLFTDLRYFSFYLFIFLSGAGFRNLEHRVSITKLIAFWVALCTASLWIIIDFNGLPNLQSEKFPPSIDYLIFSAHSVMFFCILIYLEKHKGFAFFQPPAIILEWCGRNSLRIYLWQGIAASVPYLFIGKLMAAGFPVHLIYFSSLSWNIIVSLSLVYVHNHLEKFVTSRYLTR